jgi:glycosyltransferase involved in cell wall biosynthesis
VISKTGACPEVVEDAALLADPFDADDVAGKILRLVTDGALREDLRTKGLRRMSELTWDRTARITLDALVQVVEGTRGKVEHRMNI